MSIFYNILQQIYHQPRKIKTERYFQDLIDRGLTIGEGCILPDIESAYWNFSHCYLISIGNHCGIASNVRFIAHDGSTKLFLDYTKFARIVVKDNTMIDDSTIIIPRGNHRTQCDCSCGRGGYQGCATQYSGRGKACKGYRETR